MTKTNSAKLLCGALVATIAAVQAPASADPGDINITADWYESNGTLYSGFAGTHTFGGPATVHNSYFFGSTFTATVTSGDSDRPDWTYQMNVDLSDFALFNQGGGGSYWDILLEIKEPGTNTPISGYQVKNLQDGVVLNVEDLGTTDGTINFRVLNSDIDLTVDGFIVQWNQIPAPGALALLGVAGLVGKRRRRN